MVLDYDDMRQKAARLNDLAGTERKSLEQRARRMAKRQGLTLERSRRRDPYARDFGKYRLVDDRNVVVVGAEQAPFGMDLQEVVNWLLRKGGEA